MSDINNNDLDDFDYEEWLAVRPTLTEERSHPNHWYNRAADMHAAAGALWYAMSSSNDRTVADDLGFSVGFSMGVACRPIYHMLCGLSLEIIMKAVLMQRGIAFEKTHCLERLVALLGKNITSEELALLKFYEHSIIWAGRYPIPNRCTDAKLKQYWSLASDVLTSSSGPTHGAGLQFRRGNDADCWEKFTGTWCSYASLFTVR